MSNKTRHAFGMLENVDVALQEGKIDAYDILFLKDGEGKAHVGWVDKDGNKAIIEETERVIHVDALPEVGEEGKIYIFGDDGYFWDGSQFINLCKPTDLTNLESEVAKKADADETERSYEKIKFEIVSKPEGTLVNYSDKEIRVMCPADTKWVKQNVGATGDANMYYMGFRAYAPEGAVSFKEGDRGVIVDEMFTFDGDFAGTDEFGRNYSICWLALASYNETADEWTYFGKTSSVNKYIGWTYVVEWYDTEGVVIASDSVRINLSNEDCHFVNEPYYMNNAIAEAKAYTDSKVANAIEIVEF